MYELIPFKASSQTSKIKIYAEAFKTSDEFSFNFIIEDKNKIIFLSDNQSSGRKNELWKSTCFEAFFGPAGSEAYWELNLATGGSWNFYNFDAYRNTSEPREDNRVTKIGFTKTLEDEGITRLEIKIPIQSLNLKGKVEVALCSVIEFKNKEKAYFAIKHVSDKPDFHQRDSFICNLE
jgi:hypothetical protein